MESVSASASVSSQTAEKIRAAVANYYEGYERRDAAGPDKWMVLTDDQAKDAFVRQFMRGLQKRKNSEFKQRQATPISVPYYIFSTQTVKKGKRAIEKLPPSKGPNLQIQCAVSSAYGVVAYRNKRGSIKMQDNADFVEELYKVILEPVLISDDKPITKTETRMRIRERAANVNMPKITQCMVPKMGLHAAKLVNAAIFFEDMVYGEWVDM
ncbi:uncharacterized protein PITG_17279 [Phytophthora infestans T30-4]|uniref:Uncharacterized protein n=1 Tax=Phytophthora infestans (strain T30-4) TaxID=403677 RepID=D0NVP4_PHYIT|nr:uncharacterized protein PITG_17279 [Phytophthora infestans T30-4]EEY66725.1 conserved hypothetical protein [Phytophthora infestans T30-4]|eukprot:XP_002896790.1 conserved hypothetical protein [Phytophthora infestans T30-4]